MKNLFAAVVLAIIVFFLSSCGEAVDVSSQPLYSEETVTEISQASVPEQSTYVEEEPESIDYLAQAGISIVGKTDTKIFARKQISERRLFTQCFDYSVTEDFSMLGRSFEDITITYYSEETPVEIVYDGAINSLKSISYAGKVVYETDPDNIEMDGQFEVSTNQNSVVISYAIVTEWTGYDRRRWLCFEDEIYEVDAYEALIEIRDGRMTYYKLLDAYNEDYLDTPWWDSDFDEFYRNLISAHGEVPDPDVPYYEFGEVIYENGEIKYLKENTVSIREYHSICYEDG